MNIQQIFAIFLLFSMMVLIAIDVNEKNNKK